MRKKSILFTFVIFAVFLVVTSSFGGTAKTAALKAPVIAFIDFDIAGQKFVITKDLMEEYQADAEYYNSLLKPIEDELKRLQTLGESSTTFQLKVNEYQLQQQKYQNQLQTKYNPKLETANNKLLELAKEYARLNGIDILLTNKVAVFIDDMYDVTEEFVVYANSKASR